MSKEIEVEFVKEEVVKEVEEVKENTENVVVEKVDVKIAEPVLDEVVPVHVNTTVVDTSVKVESVVIVDAVEENTGLKRVSESSLTDDQKKIALNIYVTSETAVKGIMSDASLHNSVKVTMMVGQVIKDLAHVKVGDHAPSGSDKKAVALEVGRILIKEHVAEDTHQKEIAMIYDHVAEKTLEAMIDVSKVVNAVVSKAVNAAVEEAATRCCPGLLSFFKKSA